jgi:hypothetical protein
VDNLALRELSKDGGGSFLIGGSAVGLLIDEKSYYLLENAISKVIEYDKGWNKLNVYNAPELVIFPTEGPGILEKSNDQLAISTDGIIGRWAAHKMIPEDEYPLLVKVDLKSGQFRSEILAKDLKKIMNTDSLPFLTMGSSVSDYFITSEFDAALYQFTKNGQFIEKHDVFTRYIEFEGYKWSDFAYGLGISNIFINDDNITYFIKRKTLPTSSYEIVNFNLKTAKFWVFVMTRAKGETIKPLEFKDKKLYYLHVYKDGTAFIKVVSFIESE